MLTPILSVLKPKVWLMPRILSLALCATMAAFLAMVPAKAQLAAPAPLNSEELADVARINGFLNNLKNMSGRFLQINPDGVLSEGAFYIARPGRARFDYDEEDLVVVARGQQLLIKEGTFVTNELPLDGTPLKILLGRDIDLATDARIIAVDSRAGTLATTIQDPEAPELGQVTLIFTGPTLQLQRWIVTDAQGLRTTISLTEINYPERIDPDLFRLESGNSTFRGRQD